MKLFISCLIGSLFCVALADDKSNDENKASTAAQISVSKLKRDASLLGGVYHGPSYRYLPPATIASVYDTYPGKVGSYAGYSGGHAIPAGGGAFRKGVNSHGYHTPGHRDIAVYHTLEYEPTLNYGGGYRGHVHPAVSHNSEGQGSTHFFRSGYKGVGSSHTGVKFGPGDYAANRPHTFPFANGNSIGSNTGAGGGYHYTKGFGNFHTPVSTGFPSLDGLASSSGLGPHEEHHGDHVHNGAQEHVYVVSNTPAGVANYFESKHIPVHQHPIPPAAGASFHNKHPSQTTDQGPVYAVGHKGLGHFSFTANKPQVVHASLSGASFQLPAHSKAPFKPSTFLGAKYEGSANGDIHPQQYFPALEEETASTGYHYPLPTETYHESNHHQTVEVQTSPLHETDPVYLPSKNSADSVYELSSGQNDNYLAPTDSYGNPYSH